MRLTAPLVVSSIAALLLPSVVAAKQFPRLRAKGGIKSRVNAYSERQFRVKRDVTDMCISMSGAQYAQALGFQAPPEIQALSVCLCSMDVDAWLTTNPDGMILADSIGLAEAQAGLHFLFATPGGFAEMCTIPTHAARTCELGASPCFYACESGYTPDEGSCICEEPNTECNGVCGDFSTGCGSAIPRKRRSLPITTLAQAKVTCKISESVCGIAGRENTQDYECVDTSSALDSCGGCITPHPFYEPHRMTSKGVECGRLSGVISARCQKSQCVVSQCRKGLEPSADNSECVPVVSMAERILVDGVLPIFKLNHKRQDAAINLVPNVELVAQVKDLVTAVAELNTIIISLPVQDVTAAVDVAALGRVTVDAATSLVESATVAGVVSNIQTLADSIANFKASLDACGCVEALGLDEVFAKLESASQLSASLQVWSDVNSVVHPQVAEDSPPDSSPVVIPNTSDLTVDLGLSGLLNIFGGADEPLLPPVTIHGEATADSSITYQISALADAVLQLKAAASDNFPSSSSGGVNFVTVSGSTNLDSTLADPIVQATIDFVASHDAPSALSNINTLVAANAALANALGGITNPTPALSGLLGILDTVGKTALGLKNTLNLEGTLNGVLPLGLGSILGSLVGTLTSVTGTLIEELHGKIGDLVGLVLGLQSQTAALPALLPSIPSVPSPGLPGGDLLKSVVRTVTQLLGSLGVGDLLKNLEAVIGASGTLETALGGCRCVDTLGLGDVLKGVGEVRSKALELKAFVEANKDAGLGATVTAEGSGTVLANANVLMKVLSVLG